MVDFEIGSDVVQAGLELTTWLRITLNLISTSKALRLKAGTYHHTQLKNLAPFLGTQ